MISYEYHLDFHRPPSGTAPREPSPQSKWGTDVSHAGPESSARGWGMVCGELEGSNRRAPGAGTCSAKTWRAEAVGETRRGGARMTLSRPTEGVSVPFADLSAHQQAELLGWIRSAQERNLLGGRVVLFSF